METTTVYWDFIRFRVQRLGRQLSGVGVRVFVRQS